MRYLIKRLPILLLALATGVLISMPTLAQAEEWHDHLVTWETLEHQRVAVIDRLQNLEQDHQKFVEGIEKLKEEQAQGQRSRRELENKLRENLRTVEALEMIQRHLQDIEAEQAALRRTIVQAIDGKRDSLEEELRRASPERRLELVAELNELQATRGEYAAPLPEADQKRVTQALEMARQVSGDHPRTMLSAADELEDTEEQLLAHVEALNGQISQLEQARRLHRRSQAFGEYDRFFDEDQRGRTMARFETQASGTGGQGGARGQERRSIFDQPDRRRSSDFESPPQGDAAPEEPESDRGYDEAEEGEDFFDGSDPSAGMGDDAPEAPADSEPDEQFGPDETGSDPFEEHTETVVIERDIEPGDAQDVSYFSERAMERDLHRLLHERDGLKEKAEELREKANELRRRARESR